MKRRLPAARSLGRSVELVSPKVALHIVCEGINTEPQYFSDCVDYYASGLVELEIIPGAGVPETLVNKAIEVREELLRRKRKSPDSFTACFRVWAVFDRDEHPLVEESIALALANKIDVAFSDPCFEVWPLLHLQNYGAQDGRHEVQRRLRSLMPSYEHDRGAIIDFSQIKDEIHTAFDRAARLSAERADENCPRGRPSTSVGELVLKIKQNGKR